MERNFSREGQWEGSFEVRPQDRQRWSRQTAALHNPLQRQSAASSRQGQVSAQKSLEETQKPGQEAGL